MSYMNKREERLLNIILDEMERAGMKINQYSIQYVVDLVKDHVRPEFEKGGFTLTGSVAEDTRRPFYLQVRKIIAAYHGQGKEKYEN